MIIYAEGAVTVSENTKDEIRDKTRGLLLKLMEENGIMKSDVMSVNFSVTGDINACCPAETALEMGLYNTAAVCLKEMDVPGGPEKLIRVILTAEGKASRGRHVYIGDARILRPDVVFAGRKFAIAIDGPAGSGKSTVAKALSGKLGILYVDTGAMYRGVAYHCIKNGKDPKNEKEVVSALERMNLDVAAIDGEQRVILNGEDVTGWLRNKDTGQGASDVAVFLPVREKLLEIQRGIAASRSVVMDGRDIGTHVLPDAKYKIYLTAHIDERARRRFEEYAAAGLNADFDGVREELSARDKNDMERKHNPLRKAPDALEIDSTGLNVEETVQAVIRFMISME